MKLKIGDRVSFLNQSGGGVVSSFGEKGVVNVTIDDGFEIPVLSAELIKIDVRIEESENVTNVNAAPEIEEAQSRVDDDFTETISENNSLEEGVYLAFDRISEEDINVYLVNNTGCKISYLYGLNQESGFSGIDSEQIDSFKKYLIETIEIADVEEWKEVFFQIIFFKEGASKLYNPLTEKLKIKSSKFFQDGSFVKNELFENRVLQFFIGNASEYRQETKESESTKIEKEIEKIIEEKENPKFNIKISKKHRKNDPTLVKEVDLHIENIADNSGEMLPHEIYTCQFDKFKEELEEAISKRLSKIVFIHGVGNGRLKKDISNYLKAKTGIVYYDASYKEYGKGATEVKIL